MSSADQARATALFLFASGAKGLRLLGGIYLGESYRDGLGSAVDCTARAERIAIADRNYRTDEKRRKHAGMLSTSGHERV